VSKNLVLGLCSGYAYYEELNDRLRWDHFLAIGECNDEGGANSAGAWKRSHVGREVKIEKVI
jgi:hypothetical protein